MEMVKSRRLSSHTYDENTANQIAQQVIQTYYPLFWIYLSGWISRNKKKPENAFWIEQSIVRTVA
jgi:hypothetical protein